MANKLIGSVKLSALRKLPRIHPNPIRNAEFIPVSSASSVGPYSPQQDISTFFTTDDPSPMDIYWLRHTEWQMAGLYSYTAFAEGNRGNLEPQDCCLVKLDGEHKKEQREKV